MSGLGLDLGISLKSMANRGGSSPPVTQAVPYRIAMGGDSENQRSQDVTGVPGASLMGVVKCKISASGMSGSYTVDGTTVTPAWPNTSSTNNVNAAVLAFAAHPTVVAIAGTAQFNLLAKTATSINITAVPTGAAANTGVFTGVPGVGTVVSTTTTATVSGWSGQPIMPGMSIYWSDGVIATISANGTGTGGNGTYTIGSTNHASGVAIIGYPADPIASLFPYIGTNNVGGVDWGVGPWIDTMSGGQYAHPFWLNFSVGGTDTSDWSDTSNMSSRLVQLVQGINNEIAAGRPVHGVNMSVGTNNLAPPRTLALTKSQMVTAAQYIAANVTGGTIKQFWTTVLPRGNVENPQQKVDGTGKSTGTATFTGAVSGTTLTVTGVDNIRIFPNFDSSQWPLWLGQTIGAAVLAKITTQLTGTSGGNGTYTLDTNLGTIGATSMWSSYDFVGYLTNLNAWMTDGSFATAAGLTGSLYGLNNTAAILLPGSTIYEANYGADYDGIHVAPAYRIPQAVADLITYRVALPNTVTGQLPISGADPLNLLGTAGLFANGSATGVITVSGNATSNGGTAPSATSFQITGNGNSSSGWQTGSHTGASVADGWTLATNTTWPGASNTNIRGVLAASVVSKAIGKAQRLVLTGDSLQKTTNIGAANAAGTASISGTTMTVTAITVPPGGFLGGIAPGANVAPHTSGGATVTVGTKVVSQLSSTESGGWYGGRGTYQVSISQTVASGNILTSLPYSTSTFELKIPVTLSSLTPGDRYHAIGLVEASGLAGFRGVSLELRVTDSDGVHIVQSIATAPNGTPYTTLDPVTAGNSYTWEPRTPSWVYASGQTAVLAYVFGYGAAEPSTTGTLDVSQTAVYKSVYA